MGYFIHTRDDRGQITTRCVFCDEPQSEWLDRRVDLWQRQHACDPPAVRTPTAPASGLCGVAGPEPAHSPTRTENGAQRAGETTTKEKP